MLFYRSTRETSSAKAATAAPVEMGAAISVEQFQLRQQLLARPRLVKQQLALP